MVSERTIYSLTQFLALHAQDFLCVLLTKHGLDGLSVRITSVVHDDLVRVLQAASENEIQNLLIEIGRTQADLRARIDPYRFDERYKDLQRCLELDGYCLNTDGLIVLDSSVVDASALDDILKIDLRASGLSNFHQIVQKLDDSAKAFCGSPPNFNACLNDARVAMETLASSIAQVRQTQHAGFFDPTKWGSIISYFRVTDFITGEEERGLVGVFGFVSPASHRPIGLSDQEMARLGRSFVEGMCWFLVKRYGSGV
jgi:hypothetical protein